MSVPLRVPRMPARQRMSDVSPPRCEPDHLLHRIDIGLQQRRGSATPALFTSMVT